MIMVLYDADGCPLNTFLYQWRMNLTVLLICYANDIPEDTSLVSVTVM